VLFTDLIFMKLRYKNNCEVLINDRVESEERQVVYVCCLYSKEARESSWPTGYR